MYFLYCSSLVVMSYLMKVKIFINKSIRYSELTYYCQVEALFILVKKKKNQSMTI